MPIYRIPTIADYRIQEKPMNHISKASGNNSQSLSTLVCKKNIKTWIVNFKKTAKAHNVKVIISLAQNPLKK
jgi:hypothetical protein